MAKLAFHSHVSQAIIELRSAVAAHAVGSSIDCKDTTQLAVVAPKEPFENSDQFLHS
jgi:hypothetical protein